MTTDGRWERSVSESLGRIEATLKAQNSRIQKLEDDNTRHWWFTYAIAPVLTAIHVILRKMGLDL